MEELRKMLDESCKDTDITKGWYKAEAPMIDSDEKGAYVEFLLGMDDDTYRKYAERTMLVENSSYANFDELLNSDEYLDVYVRIYSDNNVTAAISISGAGEIYDVPLSSNEKEFLTVIIADDCQLNMETTLPEIMREAVENYEAETSASTAKKKERSGLER